MEGCCVADIECDVNSICLNNKCQLSEDKLEKSTEKTAQGFAIAWQNKDYERAYDFFIPDLQELRSKPEFVKFATVYESENEFNIIYEKTVLQDTNLAYAYYTYSGDIISQPKTPAIRMDYINNTWKINGFASFFSSDCAITDCEKVLIQEVALLREPEKEKRRMNCQDYCSYNTPISCSVCQDTNAAIDMMVDSMYDKVIVEAKKSLKCDKTTGYTCAFNTETSTDSVNDEKNLENGKDFSAYPELLLKNNTPSLKIVVGAAGPTSDVVAAIDVVAGIQSYLGEKLSSNPIAGDSDVNKLAVLDSDVNNLEDNNYIIIGSPCWNKIMAKVLGLEYPACGSETGLNKGEAKLKLIENGDYSIILVMGSTAEDVLGAAYVLSNAKDYDLKGSEIKVNTATRTIV